MASKKNTKMDRIKWSMVWTCMMVYAVLSIQYPLVRGCYVVSSGSEDQTCIRNQDGNSGYKSNAVDELWTSIAVYSLCQSRPRNLGRPVYAAHNTGPYNTYYNPVLDMIPDGPKLRKSVGVISFTREYQPTLRQLLRSVTDVMGDGINVEYHVILTDDDIPDIPRCSLIVICVVYSDRDIIIEESGYDLSDCNKTTLAAAEKIGAIPVIIYCKDLSSQRLQQGRLFNPRIRCATHQRELIPLSNDNRFFSLYEDFSVTQNNAFRNLIKDHVFSK